MSTTSVAVAKTSRKILYFSCHEILEYDDLRMFTDAGHRVFSMGLFKDPEVKLYSFRNPDRSFYDLELLEQYKKLGGNVNDNFFIPQGFGGLFDVIIVNHYPERIVGNLGDRFGEVPIVARTIGQSRRTYERQYSELGNRINVVRYSGREVDLPGFAQTADVIYFAKYPSDFSIWRGGEAGITFHNGYGLRGGTCYPPVDAWQRFRSETVSRLYGANNEGVPNAGGLLPHSDMASALSKAAYYFFVYTHPPSYTLSLTEAMMAGCPIIAPSAALVQSLATMITDEDAWSPARYEVPDLLKEGGGIVYDTIKEAIYASHWISNHRGAAERMSQRALAKARETFAVEKISAQWNALFDRIC